MRLVGALRLSRDSEASVSIKKQRELITSWAKLHDHEVVAWCEDSGVSGTVDPFKRPQLSAWLTEERAGDYDAVVSLKVDRVSRRVVHFAGLCDWLHARGKYIVCVSDGIDTSTKMGKMLAQILSMFAEVELENIRDRVQTTKAELRKTVRFAGGATPYGYVSVPMDPDNPKAGRCLAVDPESSAVVADMVTRILAGNSMASIRQHLTDTGIPAPIDHGRIRQGKPAQGVQWSTRAVLAILSSPALLGQKVHKGQPVRGADGLPLQQAEPLVSLETFGRVQQRLKEASRPQNYSNPTSLLADLVYCASCGGKLYLQTQRDKGYTYRWYRCGAKSNGRKCEAPAARKAANLEDAFVGSFKKSMGHQEVTKRVWVPGEDHAADLDQVKRAIDGLRQESDAGLYDDDRPGYLARLQRLTDRRKGLEALPSRPGQWSYVGTGSSYGDAWDQAEDDGARRQLLLGAGVVAVVDANGLRWRTQG